jgi:hypothetical protein
LTAALLGVAGAILVTVGLALILLPLGLISAGGFLLFFAYTEG